MPLNTRGFTLAEVLVALGVGALVLVGVGRLLLSEKRLYRDLSQRADLSDRLRAGADILAGDLWSLDAADGDIRALGPDSIRIRAERQFAGVCAVAPVSGGVSLVLEQALTFGVRDFRVGDSLLLRASADSTWNSGVVGAVSTTGTCPQPIGEVRGFEVVTYRSYRAADGSYYLGLRDAGGLQPLAGPLATAGGLLFSFFDSSGNRTADPRSVVAIQTRIRAMSDQPVTRGGRTAYLVDSVVSWVSLRNNGRP